MATKHVEAHLTKQMKAAAVILSSDEDARLEAEEATLTAKLQAEPWGVVTEVKSGLVKRISDIKSRRAHLANERKRAADEHATADRMLGAPGRKADKERDLKAIEAKLDPIDHNLGKNATHAERTR